MYRNFKEDPFFGGDAKCIVVWQEGPFVNNSAILRAEYGGNHTVSAKTTLLSSPGYTVKNVLHAESLTVPGLGFNLTSVYTDCSRCKVFRHSYIENGDELSNFIHHGKLHAAT
ncbi:hypothetical protein V5799_027984 [Amblyomma americanum]|uniref:Uncharacterized protein n=1 Tax=Amblyomma americanum TaxID=6943 RepID=A0AAQ4DE59_AMBAM